MNKITRFLDTYRQYLAAGHSKDAANRIAYEIEIMGASF